MRRFSPALFRAAGIVVASSLGIYEVYKFSSRDMSTSKKADKVSEYRDRDVATSMKAVKVFEFGDESKLKLVTESVPLPQKNEVLVKVEAVGVNPVEVMIRNGGFGDMIKTPYIPGSDTAGTVEKVGPGVTKFKPGDRVYTIKTSSGAYAEYCVAPVDSVSSLHDGLSFSQGAALGLPYTVAYKSLFIRAQSRKGETVFVHGASGAVGLAAVQMAKAHGMKVIGSAGSPEGMKMVKAQGADAVVNHSEAGYMDKVTSAAGNQKVNVVLEMLANKNLVSDLGVLAHRGRIVVIGNKGSVENFNPSLTMGVEANIMGMVVQISTPEEYKEMMGAIDKGQGQWVEPQIAREYPMDKVADAHKDIAQGSNSFGKLILKPSQ